nr:Hsp70 family protein [uncultured Desulfobacter sp.]
MHHLGLDFGTNYISASYVNPASGRPEPVRFMDNGQEKMPALVYYSEQGVLVGQGVQSMLEQLSAFPPRERLQAQQAIVRSLKRGLNPSGTHIVPGKGAVSHVDVVTDIMAFVKQDVESGCFAGETVEKLTLTHPVVCTEAYKALLKTAAEKAGFKQVDLMEEPVAAAMGSASSGVDVGRGILVYDFGGGTFDVAFVMRDDNGQFHIPFSPLGDPWCGGDDLDMRLYEYWDREAQKQKGRSINGSAGELDAGFLLRCRRHKENISRIEKMTFTEYLPSQDGVSYSEENKLTMTLDRNIAKQLFMTDVGRTIDITKRMLSNVENAGHKVDTVILIGGSSRLPMVKELLKDSLPVNPLETMHVDVAVAMGAVCKAAPESQPVPNPQIKETQPLSSKNERESNPISEGSFYPIVDEAKCVGCEGCVEVCPAEVFEMIDNKSVPVNAEECMGCENCLIICEENAIALEGQLKPKNKPEPQTISKPPKEDGNAQEIEKKITRMLEAGGFKKATFIGNNIFSSYFTYQFRWKAPLLEIYSNYKICFFILKITEPPVNVNNIKDAADVLIKRRTSNKVNFVFNNIILLHEDMLIKQDIDDKLPAGLFNARTILKSITAIDTINKKVIQNKRFCGKSWTGTSVLKEVLNKLQTIIY